MPAWALLTLLVITLLMGPQDAKAAEFSYVDIVSLVRSKRVQSIDELVALLPLDFRSNFTLMRNSQSLQGADGIHPRVILFLPDGKLSCAFNGSHEQRGYDALECYQYSDSKRNFEFDQIEFPSPRNRLRSPAFSAPNHAVSGTSCTQCHGADPRPNWESYPNWPGAYGSNDDYFDYPYAEKKESASSEDFPPGTAASFKSEYDGFLKFKASYKKSPRYRALLFPSGSRYSPYGAGGDLLGTQEFRPNLRFTSAIKILNAHRDARLLEQLPRSKIYQFLMTVSGCPISPDEEKNFPEMLANGVTPPVSTGDGVFFPDTAAISSTDSGNYRSAPAILGGSIPAAAWGPFFRGLNANCSECASPGITPPPSLLFDGSGNGPWSYDYESGDEATSDLYVANDVMDYLVKSGDQDLSRYYQPVPNFNSQYGSKTIDRTQSSQRAYARALDSDGAPLNAIRASGACGLFYSHFKASYAAESAAHSIFRIEASSSTQPCKQDVNANDPLSQAGSLAAIQQNAQFTSCIQCHSGTSAAVTAPYIPFSDPIALKKSLTEKASDSSGTLYDALVHRLNSDGPDHMPMGSKITTAEKAAILTYIESIMNH